MIWNGKRLLVVASGASGIAILPPVTLPSWEAPTPSLEAVDLPHTVILGVPFFTGTVEEAVDRMLTGGLLVVPSAPTLKDIPSQPAYRAALLSADLVIPDSAYMVLIWNLLKGGQLRRISGLKYLRELLRRPELRKAGSTIWIMAGTKSAALNVSWLRKQGVEVDDTHVYIAPQYGPTDGSELCDPELLEMVARLHPAHVVVTVGGGTQERLGMFLRRNSSTHRASTASVRRLRFSPATRLRSLCGQITSTSGGCSAFWTSRKYTVRGIGLQRACFE